VCEDVFLPHAFQDERRVGAFTDVHHQRQPHLRGRIAGYKIPREFTVIAELERTPTGKLRRWTESGSARAEA
jgi:acyl-CoA synthetase (AMP-forming)/AMP-acid ligase II